MYISLNWNDFLLSFQVDCMWGGDATLCGGQHIPQVPHHHQVLPENVEQCQRDTNLHLSGCGDGWRPTRLELDLRHRHCHSVPGCPGHRSAPLQYFLANKCHGVKGTQNFSAIYSWKISLIMRFTFFDKPLHETVTSDLQMQINKCKNETLYSFKGGKCILVYFEVNKKDLCKTREPETLTGVSVSILSHHTAFSVREEVPLRISMSTSDCHKSFCWWFVMLELLVLLERESERMMRSVQPWHTELLDLAFLASVADEALIKLSKWDVHDCIVAINNHAGCSVVKEPFWCFSRFKVFFL